MNVPRPMGASFMAKDQISNLSTPGLTASKSLNPKAPLKLPPKGSAIKIIQKSQIDTESPAKDLSVTPAASG